jgi:hypothetical protein
MPRPLVLLSGLPSKTHGQLSRTPAWSNFTPPLTHTHAIQPSASTIPCVKTHTPPLLLSCHDCIRSAPSDPADWDPSLAPLDPPPSHTHLVVKDTPPHTHTLRCHTVRPAPSDWDPSLVPPPSSTQCCVLRHTTHATSLVALSGLPLETLQTGPPAWPPACLSALPSWQPRMRVTSASSPPGLWRWRSGHLM